MSDRTSDTFTDAQGRFYVAGEEVSESVYRRVEDLHARLEQAVVDRVRLRELGKRLASEPHYIRCDTDGWFIRHPMGCDGDCDWTAWARETLDEQPEFEWAYLDDDMRAYPLESPPDLRGELLVALTQENPECICARYETAWLDCPYHREARRTHPKMTDRQELRARYEHVKNDHVPGKSCPCFDLATEAFAAWEQAEAQLAQMREAWGESWDCSRDPGHRIMNEAIARLEEC